MVPLFGFVEEEDMRVLGFFAVAALLLACSEVWAAKTYPNDMDDFHAKYPLSRTNINTRSSQPSVSQSDYPKGKNAHKPQSVKTVGAVSAPKKTVCVGSECGCMSGKHH